MTNSLRTGPWWVWLIVLVGAIWQPGSVWAQSAAGSDNLDDWERLRVLFVPQTELPSVMAQGDPRVLLSRAEAVQLLQQWRTAEEVRRQAKIEDFSVIGPQGLVWEQAQYELTLASDSARLRGSAVGSVHGQQPVSLPLPWKSGWLQELRINDQLPIWHVDDQGSEALLLPPQTNNSFSLDLTLPVTTDSVRQSVALHLPSVTVGRMTAKVRGNVELIAGAPVLERAYDANSDTTTFELAAGQTSTELVFSLNNRQKQQTLLWDCRVKIRASLTRVLEQFEIGMENRVVQGELSQAAWDLPADLEVAQVAGVGVRQWQVEPQAGGQRLSVWLHPEQAQQPIRVVAFRTRATANEVVWEPPVIAAVGAIRQPRLVDLSSSNDWIMTQAETEQMDVVPVGVAATMLSGDAPEGTTSPTVGWRRLGTWYGTDPSSRLSVTLRAAADRYAVTASHYVMVSKQGLDGRSVFVIENEGDLRFQVRLRVPRGFQISSVADAEGPLPFRKVTATDLPAAEWTDVDVTLRRGIGGNEQVLRGLTESNRSSDVASAVANTLELVVSSRSVPEGWFADLPERTLKLTPPQVGDAATESGILAIGVASDWAIQAVESGTMLALGRQELLAANLASVEPNLAFDLNGTDGTCSVDLVPKVADLLVNTVTFYQLEATRQRVQGELLIDVRDGVQESFQIQLPAAAPDAVLFTCVAPVAIRQQRRVAEVPGRWQVQLTGPVTGRVHLTVSYDVPLELNRPRPYELDGLTVVSAALQTRLVSVEGAEGLATQIQDATESWSLDRLPETQYQPGRRLIGLWELAENQPPLTMLVREQTLAQTPLAVVQSRSFETRLATDGTVVTLAAFEIRSNAGALWLKLPPSARLWSLTHQGVPQTVPSADGRLRVALPQVSGDVLHRVEFFYADQSGFDRLEESLSVNAPAWYIAADESDQNEVPVLQTQWRLTPPPGWVLRQPSSDWVQAGTTPGDSWLTRNWTWLAQQSRALRAQANKLSVHLPSISTQESAQLAPGNAYFERMDAEFDNDEMLFRYGQTQAGSGEAAELSRSAEDDRGRGRPGAERRSTPRQAGGQSGMSGRAGMGGMSGPAGQAGMGGGMGGRPSDKPTADSLADSINEFSDEDLAGEGRWSREQNAALALPPTNSALSDQPAVAFQGALPRSGGPNTGASSLNFRGYRSLVIEADPAAEAIVLTGLGNKPSVHLALMQGAQVDRWSWAIGLFGLAIGLMLGRFSIRAWLLWLALLLSLSIAAQWLHESLPILALSLERLMWFVVALIIWRLLTGCGSYLTSKLSAQTVATVATGGFRRRLAEGASVTSTILVFTLGWLACGDVVVAQTSERPSERPLVTPLDLPAEAIVVLYDPAAPQARLNGQWLVPRDWWERVKRLPSAERATGASPQAQLAARGDFSLRLVGQQALELQGTWQVVVPETGPIFIPVEFGTGRLLTARQGARDVTIIEQREGAVATDPAANAGPAQVDNRALPLGAQPLPPGLWIKLTEPGLQTIELRVHYPLETRPGGWQAAGRLPGALATRVALHALPSQSRVEWSTAIDTRQYTVPEAGTVDQLGVGADGQFQVKWRAAADQARIGSSSIGHDAWVTLRETGVEVRSDLRVTVAEATDELVLDLPPNARLESIQSPQLRGWSFTSESQDRVLLQFLQPAREMQFQTRLVGDQAFWSAAPVELEVPWPRLPDSGPVTGLVHVLRSIPLRVNVVAAEDLRRAEATNRTADSGPWLTWGQEVFGLVPYQVFQWQASNAKLRLQVERPTRQTEVTHRNIFQFEAKRATFESQLTVTPRTGDLRRVVVRVPARLSVSSILCLGQQGGQDNSIPFQLIRRSGPTDDLNEWELRLDEPQSEPVRLVWLGTVPSEIGQPFVWQPLQVLDAIRETYEYALTKADNLDLTAAAWESADSVSPSEFQGWLNASRLAQLPLSIRASAADHTWTVVPQRAVAVVSFESVTDLTVADRVVEESLLLEWKIERSGIDQVQFALPAMWRDCRIEGPWIGRVQRSPVAEGRVQFTVFLQDRILGDYRLVATLDLPRSARSEATATIPRALTGETRQQWVTAQNTSQAEVEFTAEREVTALQRQQRVFGELQRKIGVEYLANAFVVNTNATEPRLTWRTVQRTTLETRSAQIRLSETDLMLDRQGTYIARQRLQIKNRNQPTLQLQLPDGSQLVAVMVDNQAVQPLAVPGQAAGLATVPLVSSSVLNLDYPIEFLYRGQLPTVESWESIEFPLAYATDVEAEVSHLRLHLPAELQPILFTGTMTQVDSSGELVEEVADYQTKVLAEFKQLAMDNTWSKTQRNRRLSELETYIDGNQLLTGAEQSSRLNKEMEALGRVMQETGPTGEDVVSNRAKLRGLVGQQFNRNEQEISGEYLNNFVSPEMALGQQIADRELQQSQQGQNFRGGKQAADSRGNANQRLAETLQADKSIQEKRDSYAVKGEEAASSPAEPERKPGRGQVSAGGLLPPFPAAANAPNAAPAPGLAPAQGPALAAAEPQAQRVPTPRLDFQPSGEVYYFRVPRGRPELTATLTTRTARSKTMSSLELAGAVVVALILAACCRRRRSKN